MSFEGDIHRFVAKVERRRRDLFVGSATAVHSSIQLGSPITGAPGQPVDTGNLRASWQLLFESPTLALVMTAVEYAPPIEDGVGRFGPLTLRSQVGGWHSVRLSRAGWPRLVEDELRKLGDA